MNKALLIIVTGIATLALSGCSYFSQPTKIGLTETKAKNIAEKNCIKEGESLSSGYYNENSKTWWFDINVNPTKKGCNPACVVSEDTKTTEINRRCLGLSSKPNESTSDILKNFFVEKYPKYKKTLTIKIYQETQNHARGSIIFESGAPGGLFLAAKINDKRQIVFNGNGQFSCNLSKYGFPTNMLYDCAPQK